MIDECLLDRLRGRNWRITPQRRAVAQVMEGEHVHLTADQIYDRARSITPDISLATVYNTLRELVGMSEVGEITAAAGPVRYDPNVTRPHDHLTCLGCGELLDVYPEGDDRLRLGDTHGYEVVGVSITFKGYCSSCRGSPT